jgi:hypothetical protein
MASVQHHPKDISAGSTIHPLKIKGMSMLGAVLDLGREWRIPVGIRYLDDTALGKLAAVDQHPEEIVVQNTEMAPRRTALYHPTISFALGAVVGGAGDRWELNGGVISVDHTGFHWYSGNLLDLRLAEFAIPRCTLEEANHRLEVALDAALHPGAQVVTGDEHPGTGKDMVGPLKFRDRTVAEVLDTLVAKEGHAAWTVQVPPVALDRLVPEGLWKIIDYDDPAFDQAVEAVEENILRYPGSKTFLPEPTEYVQVSAVSVSPTTLNLSSSPSSATVTVQVYHENSRNLYGSTVMVNVATTHPSPSGNNVSILPTEQLVPVMGEGGYVTVEFPVTAIPGTTVSGSIGIRVWLTNLHPSENMMILDADPATNAETTLTITSK